MTVITESKMEFGPFSEEKLFYIEKSKIFKSLGNGVKTVEFILKYNKNNIFFVEAKESCPNAANRSESEEKEYKFEEYYSSITEKFIDSLQIILASTFDRFDDVSEIGGELQTDFRNKDTHVKFVLVIKKINDIKWLVGPCEELRARLIKFRKIWNVDIIVMNEDMAREKKLIV